MKRSMFLIGLLAAVMLFASGCSTITVQEFDKDTGKMVKQTETKNTTVATIVTSTEHKSIVMWTSGWLAWIEASPGTSEDPTPHGKFLVGNMDKGLALFHKDQQNMADMAKVIQACRANFYVVGASGNSAGSNADSPPK